MPLTDSQAFHAWASRQPSTKERLRAFWSHWFRMENPHMTAQPKPVPAAHHGDIDETTRPTNPANTYSSTPLPWKDVRGAATPPVTPQVPPMHGRADSILLEAHALVYGPRQHAYGHPANDFSRTAALANTLLARKLKADLDARDVALFMVCVKLSREVNKHGRDNLVDAAGYLETLRMVEEFLDKLKGQSNENQA